MRSFLVTGGAGSFGTAFVQNVYGRDKVTVYSRDPLKHVALKEQFPSVRTIVGDVQDEQSFSLTLRETNPDVVIHAAALKHLGAGEENPLAYVLTNVIGTFHVARACILAGIPTALLLSTDKAVDPINFYGFSKAMAERIWAWAGQRSDKASFIAVRFGNVFDSRGSVLRRWARAKAKGEPIVVRTSGLPGYANKSVYDAPTRFVLSLQDVVSFALEAIDLNVSGLFVPLNLSSVDIFALAHEFTPSPELAPVMPGEKIHEVLVSRHERMREGMGRLARVELAGREEDSRYSSKDAPHLLPRVVMERFRYVIFEEGFHELDC